MIEMTLSSRHRIRNSSPGGLRPSTLPHQLSEVKKIKSMLPDEAEFKFIYLSREIRKYLVFCQIVLSSLSSKLLLYFTFRHNWSFK